MELTIRRVAFVFASLLVLSMATGAYAKDNCEALASLALPEASITSAKVVDAGQYQLPDNPLSHLGAVPGMNLAGRVSTDPNPAFCRVAATLKPSADSDIKIEVWLPLSGWNGKLLGVGSFGWGGALMLPGMLTGLEQGYAVAATDTGHDSSTEEGEGGHFTLGHPQKLIDYSWRADHLMTVQAKALIQAYYGKPAAHSYWVGCSLGGLEGLIEAKRFPEDYDGIVAGAPPNPIVKFNAAQLWTSWLINSDPSLNMTQAKFDTVSKAALKACRTPVGQQQGFIEAPDRCNFEPGQLLCRGADTDDCLTEGQVRLMREIYAGPIDPHNLQVIFPGPAKGSERQLGAFVDGKPMLMALDLFQYAALQDPRWDWTTLDWDKTVNDAVAKLGPLMHVDADLKPFFARGGKLLMYVGWNDFHNPEELISYYRALMRGASDKTRDSAKLFTIPGMGHCFGGEGCDTFDKLGTLDHWVSNGEVPQRILASRISDGQVQRTRPLCAYPLAAHYDGSGDMDKADSFACVDPAMGLP